MAPLQNLWYVVLRDIMVILAAAMLILTSLFSALLAWRLYRMGRRLQSDLEPIVASVRDTADTVRDAAAFTGSNVVSSAVSAVGMAAGALEVVQVLRQLYKGLHAEEKGESGET